MKRVKNIGVLIFAIMIIYALPVSAKPSNTEVMSLYNQFLSSGGTYHYSKVFSFRIASKRKFKQNITETIDLSHCYFNVVDIDKNGVKELILKQSNSDSTSLGPCGWWYYVFTVKAGAVVPVGHGFGRQDYSATIRYVKSKKALFFCYTTAGTDSVYVYYMKKGKIKKIDAYNRSVDWGNNVEKYYKNGKTISMSKYKKQAWGIKLTTVNLYENNQSNRSAILS